MLVIINVHAPTESKDDEAKDVFYSLLIACLPLVVWNFNAKVGEKGDSQNCNRDRKYV